MGALLVGVSEGIFAQIVPDNSLGAEGSIVTPNVTIRGIPSVSVETLPSDSQSTSLVQI